MKLPKVELRHAFAFALGGALLVMPLLILSYDPDSGLERLRQPLCKGGLVVEVSDPYGADTLPPRETGLKVRALRDDAPVSVRVSLFIREPGTDWRFHWALDAPEGKETFVVQPKPTTEYYVRAVDPTGDICPADSAVIRVRAAA